MFATIFLPNFYLQAALRHQARVPAGAACYSGPKTFGAGSKDSTKSESVPLEDKMSVPPVALIDGREKKAVIIQVNRAAETAGVTKGMTPSQGLARCVSLVIKTRSRSQEQSIEEIVFHYAFSLSPFVEATSPGVCTVQFTHDRQLLSKVSRVIEQLAACEITAQAGLAPNADTSFLAAHLARPVLEIKHAKQFLAPLSIDTLMIPFES